MSVFLFILLAAWVIPAVLTYVLVGLDTGNWSLDKEDLVLFAPGVSVVTFCLTVVLIIEDRLFNE